MSYDKTRIQTFICCNSTFSSSNFCEMKTIYEYNCWHFISLLTLTARTNCLWMRKHNKKKLPLAQQSLAQIRRFRLSSLVQHPFDTKTQTNEQMQSGSRGSGQEWYQDCFNNLRIDLTYLVFFLEWFRFLLFSNLL